MTERNNITNLLLLCVLTGILLVSGSLQCAFDCLTKVDNLRSSAIKVNACHLNFVQIEYADNCPNNACHQVSPVHRDLGGPEIHSFQKLPQPLFSSYRQPAPQFRSGSPLILTSVNSQPLFAFQATTSSAPLHARYGIQTTILLN